LRAINRNIYQQRKSADYLIGHAYFLHARSIHEVLDKKVIPLLSEYFNGKVDVIAKIFKGSGWTAKYNEESYRWDLEHSEAEPDEE
jgi:5-methylcytosine-specific restriction protein B